MHFERRELKPYAEPVDPARLREGITYFMVQFIDEEMLIPVMEPVTYIGRNLEPEDLSQFYFQDVASYIAGARYGIDNSQGGTIYQQAENEVNHIFEYEHGLDVLLGCSLRRKKAEGK